MLLVVSPFLSHCWCRFLNTLITRSFDYKKEMSRSSEIRKKNKCISLVKITQASYCRNKEILRMIVHNMRNFQKHYKLGCYTSHTSYHCQSEKHSLNQFKSKCVYTQKRTVQPRHLYLATKSNENVTYKTNVWHIQLNSNSVKT